MAHQKHTNKQKKKEQYMSKSEQSNPSTCRVYCIECCVGLYCLCKVGRFELKVRRKTAEGKTCNQNQLPSLLGVEQNTVVLQGTTHPPRVWRKLLGAELGGLETAETVKAWSSVVRVYVFLN